MLHWPSLDPCSDDNEGPLSPRRTTARNRAGRGERAGRTGEAGGEGAVLSAESSRD